MQEKTHIASLDGLRGMAAAAVVFSHLHLIFPSLAAYMLDGIGGRAVAIFFALSGFLMAYLYGDRPISRQAVADFLVSRFSRIYPVYLVAVLVVVALSSIPGFDFINPIHGAKEIIRHVMLFGSTGVLWSVPPEIQFYLLFPLLWLLFSDSRRYQTIGVLMAGFLAVDALVGFPGPGIPADFQTRILPLRRSGRQAASVAGPTVAGPIHGSAGPDAAVLHPDIEPRLSIGRQRLGTGTGLRRRPCRSTGGARTSALCRVLCGGPNALSRKDQLLALSLSRAGDVPDGQCPVSPVAGLRRHPGRDQRGAADRVDQLRMHRNAGPPGTGIAMARTRIESRRQPSAKHPHLTDQRRQLSPLGVRACRNARRA
jgi:hypothetical protein